MAETNFNPDKLRPREERLLDIRLIDSLKKGEVYSLNQLEEIFGITEDDGLLDKLSKHISLKHEVPRINADESMYKFEGRHRELDLQSMAELRKRGDSMGEKKVLSCLSRMVINQTYSVDDLVGIFNLRVNEGLFRVLAPYAKLDKLEDGNFKLREFLVEVPDKIEEGVGYNPLVQEVVESLGQKYQTEYFRFTSQDLPGELKRKMPPGLLPKILQYLKDSGILEENPSKPGWHRIAEKIEE